VRFVLPGRQSYNDYMEVENKNATPYRTRASVWRMERTKRHQTEMENVKREHGCKACGERTLCVLDFHHHYEKGIPVSRAANYCEKRFKEELRKCVVLCANCHRKVHAGELTIL